MMAGRRPQPRDDRADVGQPPPTTPGHASPVFTAHDHSFTLQAIMELQKGVGELKSSIESLKGSVDSTKARVDDLVSWKNKILGGAIAIGAVISLLAFLIAKFSDYIEIRSPRAPAVSAPGAPSAPAQVPTGK